MLVGRVPKWVNVSAFLQKWVDRRKECDCPIYYWAEVFISVGLLKTTEGNQNIIIVILFWYTDFMSVSIFLSIFSFIHHLFMVMVNLGSIELALTYLVHKKALRWPKLGSGSENIMQMGRYVLKIGNKGIYIYQLV